MTVNDKKSISIVVPVYNEEKGIASFHSSLIKVLNKIDIDFEIIYVDDGSSDNSLSIIKQINDNNIKVVVLSRNFGKEIALSAGVALSHNQGIIMLDGDGQHPVDLIPEFIHKWRSGADVVIGIRRNSKAQSFMGKINSIIFYKFFNFISSQKIIIGATDFRLIDRCVADEFNQLGEQNRMTRYLIDWLGFERQFVEFDANEREHGEATYSTRKLIDLAINLIVSSSPKPLYLFSYLGVLICFLSSLLGVSLIIEQLILGDPLKWKFTGTAMLGILVIFLVGIVLMSQGIISLYISRIHDQSKERPLYVIDIRKSVGFNNQKILKHKS